MITAIRFPSIALTTCLLLPFIAPSALSAGEPTYSNLELQEMYVSYLGDEGYVPTVDRDGDVTFKSQGTNYYIAVDASDPQFFRLVYCPFWKSDDNAELQKVLIAAATAACLSASPSYWHWYLRV